MFPLPDSHSAASERQTKSQGEGTTMTTHNNTPKDQYHRAPLNGLLIGAIIGAVWAVVLLIIHVTTGRHHAYARISLMCFIFPLVGWITGLWGRTIKTCETPKKRKHKITTIGVTMATLTGLAMTIIYHTFICTADPHKFIPDGATFSSRAFVVYLVPLIMFPPAGWSLGVARGNIPQDDRSLVSKMSFEAVVALAGSVAIWYLLTAFLSILLFFGA
ncbi:Uncharacterised protein [Cutibacterium granulosum]|nr:Uncharacterised protein [Cutibacterium granulosum]